MDDWVEVFMGLTMAALIFAFLFFLGWAVADTRWSAGTLDARVERCENVQGVPLVDRDSRVLCFNPQVVQEVK